MLNVVVSIILGTILVLSAVSVASLSDAYAEISSSGRELPYVMIGSGGLIDRYHVVQGKEFQANWRAAVEVKSNGSFSIGLELFYLSDNPTIVKVQNSQNKVEEFKVPDLRPITSVAFLQLEGFYRGLYESYDEREKFTEIVPVYTAHVNDREVNAVYDGTYNTRAPKVNEELYAISMKISWLRVFEDNSGNWYYQWMQGSKDSFPPADPLKLDEPGWSTGDLIVYYPIPESSTSSEAFGLDYVKWIREQIFEQTEFQKILIGLSRFPYPPSMVADSEGSLHIVWSGHEESEYFKGSGVSGLSYAKVDAYGKLVVPPQIITSGSITTEVSTAIYNDRIHVVWEDSRHHNEPNEEGIADGNSELYYMQLDKDGKVVIDEKRITSAQGRSAYPSIAVDTDGAVHVAWEEWRDSYPRVVGTRPGCVEQSTEQSTFRLWSFDLYKEEGCEIYEGGGSVEIYYAKLNTEGSKIIDDKRITFKDEFANGISFRPRIAFDGSEQLHLVWWDRRDASSSDLSNEAEIYYTKLDLAGNKLMPDLRVTRAAGDSAWPDLAVDSSGNAHIVWFDNRSHLESESGSYDIYKTTLSSNGTRIADDAKISFNSEYFTAGWPNIAIDENDNVHVVWSGGWMLESEPPDGHRSGIYYTRMNAVETVEQLPIFISEGGAYSDLVVSKSKAYTLYTDGLTGVSITAVPEFPVNLMAVTAIVILGMVTALRIRRTTLIS